MVDFKALRKKSGLTQAELAEKVGVSENTIQNWESGKTDPKGDNWKRYMQALGITDQAEIKRIISERTEATYIKDIETADNVPYFLFEDKPEQIDIIKNCYASAEELDMLGYEYYLAPKGRIVSDMNVRFPMDYVFFEKHGGFNQTTKIMNDAKKRLGKLREDAIKYAVENPGCEYRLVSFDKEKLLDMIGVLIDKKGLRSELKKLYDHLKTIELVGAQVTNIKNLEARMNKSKEILRMLDYYLRDRAENRSLGILEGYVRVIDESQVKPDLNNVELTERGKQIIELVESDEYSIKNAVYDRGY